MAGPSPLFRVSPSGGGVICQHVPTDRRPSRGCTTQPARPAREEHVPRGVVPREVLERGEGATSFADRGEPNGSEVGPQAPTTST